MSLSDKEINFIERNWRKIPFNVLARKYQMSEIELLKLLRGKGIVTEVQPVELQYIRNNIGEMPPEMIVRDLGLTQTQFAQICQKVLKVKQSKSLADLTLDEVTNKVKWLLEKKLRLPLDDFLPRQITSTHFVKNNLYECVRFAENHKRKDEHYRHFSAVAYLICQSYPEIYRPFQFRHSKTNNYFRGPGGKKNFISAVRWVLEMKMGLNPSNFSDYANNKYFLRNSDLQFYGIGPYWSQEHFGSKRELVKELARVYRTEGNSTPASLRYLRQQLRDANVAVDRCYVEGCSDGNEYGVHIHHIVPREYRNAVRFDVHQVSNLVPVCPNHHAKAEKFDWEQLLGKPDEVWREELSAYLSNGKI